MCMIAGYIGHRPAGPILLDMLRRQEAINGGFYTGIGTCDGEAFHVRKVVGSAAALEESTNLESLRGTIGIGHSRTDEGGGLPRAQPYLDCTNELGAALWV